MKIEIKNFRPSPAFSEETLAFTARVYVDGKYAFDVKNDGNGGSHYYMGDRDKAAKAEAWARSLPPKVYEGMELPSDLDLVIDDLVAREMAKKDLKKVLRNHAVFLDLRDGCIYTAKHMLEEQAAQLYGRENVLNLMPFEEALKFYIGVCGASD